MKFEDLEVGMKFVNKIDGHITSFIIEYTRYGKYFIQWPDSKGLIDRIWWDLYSSLYELDSSWLIKKEVKEWLDEQQ